jgi:hypothetical protein
VSAVEDALGILGDGLRMLDRLRPLAAPINMMVDLLSRDDHSEDEEARILFAMQRAVADERARRKFQAG